MTPSIVLDGHVPESHPLALRSALGKVINLAQYEPETLWEQDTRLLPWDLRRYRRRLRDFAQSTLRPLALEADLAPHDADRDARVLALGAQAGLLTDMLPAPFGSKPLWLFRHPLQWHACIKVEELCAACGGLGLFLSAHVLGTAPLLLNGTPSTGLRHLLPAYRSTRRGEPFLLAFAITEPTAGSDVEESHGASVYKPRTVARKVDGGYLINGTKSFISGGDLARGVTLFAALEGEGMESWTCFFVHTDRPGFEVVRNEVKMGQRASGAAELLLTDVFVRDRDVVGAPREGWGINRATLNFSRMPVGAIALGIARGAMEAAMEFVCRFELGGKRLIEYQEVQLAVAQMLAETTALRGFIWQSAKRFTPTQAKASMVKFHSADRAVRVCDMAMDLMGNHSVFHENYVEKCFRDSRLCQIYEGTNQINRLGVIEDIQAEL